VPVVLLDRHSAVLDADSVLIDNVAAGRTAVSHLLAEGHRRIGVLASVDPVERPEFEMVDGGLVVHGAERPSIDRIRGYLEVMREAGAEVTEKLVCSAALGDVADADRGAAELLTRTPRVTAVFATDNVTTQGLYTAIRRLGLRIPEDVSLVGFDDLDWTTLVEPALTVVAQSPLEMGRMAAQRLFARIKGDESTPQQHLVPTRLLVRGSTAAPTNS
jgi:LacI family transcriptional regulator